MDRKALFCALSLISLVGALALSGCSSNGMSSTTNAGASVNVRISDPATCSGPKGAFSHIYVTITDVQINATGSAGNNDSGWIDLTPSLSQSPQQVDLLGQASNQCFLATLGATTALQPGSYQQIRIMLASNATVIANNICDSSAN